MIDFAMSLEDGLAKLAQAHEQSLKDLQKVGVRLDSNPPVVLVDGKATYYDGRIPSDLTTLSNNNLGLYLGLLAEWKSHLNNQLSVAQRCAKNAEIKMKFVRDRLRISFNGQEGLAAGDKTARINIDKRFLEQQSEFIRWDAFVKYLRPLVDTAEGNYAAISRRISQISNELDAFNRGRNVGGIPNYGALK
jgi:hypothetical protein